MAATTTSAHTAPGRLHSSTPLTIIGRETRLRMRLTCAMRLKASNPARAPVWAPFKALRNSKRVPSRNSRTKCGAAKRRNGGQEGSENEERQSHDGATGQRHSGRHGDDTASASRIGDAELRYIFCGGYAEAEASKDPKHSDCAVDDGEFTKTYGAKEACGDDRSNKNGALRRHCAYQRPEATPCQATPQ